MAVAAPNLTYFAALPGGSTTVFTGVLYLAGLWVANADSVQRTIQITDGSGKVIVPTVPVPANGMLPLEAPMMPLTGLIAVPSTGGVVTLNAWGWSTWPMS